jgi:hypothetical protein
MKKNRNKIILIIVCVLVGYTVFFFYNKSEKVYVLKEYDSKTKITGTNEYVIRDGDTIFHGKFINYNVQGTKIAEGNFINGHIKGKCFFYYDNGKIETVEYRKIDEILKESFEYYPNGKIKRYIMFDPFGLEAFIARYDEKGNLKNHEGYSLMEIYQYPIAHKEQFKIKTNQYLRVGDKLKYCYIVANIPNAKRSFKIENLSVDNSKVKRTQKNIIPNQINIEEILTKKGKNTIRSIVRYEFNDKVTPVFTDTLSFEVNVN